MKTIYLRRDDLIAIQKFMDAFPDEEYVELNADSSSGIGALLTVTIKGVEVNGTLVDVSKQIVDESSW